VVSEEFGDGDLAKNHVAIYNDLLRFVSANGKAASGDIWGFDGLPQDEGSSRCWTAAIAQQCVGLLAGDGFFPESIGFNMAYETLPFHLLVTSYELRELNIDDYYFALHITIDNPDSGHAALGRIAVEKYLAEIKAQQGEAAMETMWRRVQAGVVLADGLPTTPSGQQEFTLDQSTGVWRLATSSVAKESPVSVEERQLVELLGRKAVAAEKMHCPSRMLVKGQPIEYWLQPTTMTPVKGLEFIRELAQRKPWILPGRPNDSKLFQMLGWGGRMFGAFSRDETAFVRRWIVSLAPEGTDHVVGAYNRFVGAIKPSASSTTIAKSPSQFRLDAIRRCTSQPGQTVTSPKDIKHLYHPLPIANSVSTKDSTHLVALWFTSLSLLELFPLSPSKLASPVGMTALRILRAQLGFPALHKVNDICAGIDDTDSAATGLWEIGQTISKGYNLPLPPLSVGVDGGSPICNDMLELRLRPYGQQAILFGMTYAFATYLLNSDPVVRHLNAHQVQALATIRSEIVDAIEEHIRGSHIDADWWNGFTGGYARVRIELASAYT